MVLEILQPQLATYTHPEWFHLNATKDAVVMSANWDGATTPNSNNPRCELREMVDNGNALANWDGRTGHHRMDVELKVTRLDGAHHVVIGQIHDKEDDVSVFRVEGNQLWITDYDNPHGYLIGNYTLGTKIKYGFDVYGGEIHYRFNGTLLPYTHPISDGNYYRAGCYLQVKQNSGGATVELYSVKVSHT